MKRNALLALMAVVAMLSAGLWAQTVGPKPVSSNPADEIMALENAFIKQLCTATCPRSTS